MNEDGIRARFHLVWARFGLDIDVNLPGRGVTALFGPSGSGKTTLLRCIAGLEHAPRGTLYFKGECWQDTKHWLPPHLRPIGYVFQEASLFPHLTVIDNLRYGWKRLPHTRRTSLDPIIELLGIGHLLPRKPERLSGGERQRVGIARALAVNPRLLLMDEPLAALDVARKQEILPYLERLHRQLAIPILYVSHAPDEVARLADYLVVLEQGHVITTGPLQETLARIDLPIRLGEEAGVVLEGVIVERDESWQLAKVAFAGGALWTRDHGIAIGQNVRVRALARDISLAIQRCQGSSILNELSGTVEAIATDTHPGLVLVRVKVGETPFVARLTHRSLHHLQIHIGQPVWVYIKSVALIA